VVADRDYDVEYNYNYAEKNGVKLTIKPKLYKGRKYKGKFRTKVQAKYSPTAYRKRKKVERQGEILRVIAHNMKAYFMQEAWGKIFTNL